MKGALNDKRNIISGTPIPCEDYCDQPYIVRTNDGAWLCVMTTARGHEGTSSQHVVATRSFDQGQTWSALIDIEPSGPPESSYATLLKVPSGRIYAFYNHNSDNLREVIASTDYARRRVDTLGYFVFKYSDDGGQSWSAKRYRIPVREFEIDRKNPYNGEVRFFWHVGKPLIHNGAGYVSLHKVGRFGEGFMERSEGVFLRSENILTERDAEKIIWQTLPDGEIGLRAPAGPVADEHKLVALSDDSLFCTYRTTDGHSCHAYSHDDGHNWTAPEYMIYEPNGRKIKHSRAANFVWRCSNGKYLYWFHNHGGRGYPDRNPAWICGGEEIDVPTGKLLRWSQPEVLLYDADPNIRVSYPDLVEQNGKFWMTETQKTIARVHELDTHLLEAVWNQFSAREVAKKGLSLQLADAKGEHALPRLPILSQGGGFSIEFWLRLEALASGQILLDSRRADGCGIALTTTERGTLQILLSDGRSQASWDCDTGVLQAGLRHHVVVSVDGGPKIISFVIDGVLCDGGTQRQFGWGRFNPYLGDVNGAERAQIAPNLRGQIEILRVYNRFLLNSEAVSNWRAGTQMR